jgi:hypothetical protein
MSQRKEIHYLDRDVPMFGNARKVQMTLTRKDGQLRKKLPPRRRPLEERDVAFLDNIAELRGKPRDIAKYGELFRYKNGQLSGDVTPGYSGVRAEVIREITEQFPQMRILQFVRDPVARAWSQLSMAERRERFSAGILETPDIFRAYLEQASDARNEDASIVDLAKVGFATRATVRWEENALKLRFQHFFFDDIVERPEALRVEILTFLGADPAKAGGPWGKTGNPATRNFRSRRR